MNNQCVVAVIVVLVEQTTAPTAQVSRPDCDIPGSSGPALHNSHNPKALRGCSQSGRAQATGPQAGESEDRQSEQFLWSKTIRGPETVVVVVLVRATFQSTIESWFQVIASGSNGRKVVDLGGDFA